MTPHACLPPRQPLGRATLCSGAISKGTKTHRRLGHHKGNPTGSLKETVSLGTGGCEALSAAQTFLARPLSVTSGSVTQPGSSTDTVSHPAGVQALD